MSQDASTSSTAENSTSTLTTDLRSKAEATRRYKIIERDGIRIRLQSWTAKEFKHIATFANNQQTDIGITYAIVDENGDCTHTHDLEGAAYLQDLDAEFYTWLAEHVNDHCLGGEEKKS